MSTTTSTATAVSVARSVGPLRERLAARELEEARAVLAGGGAAGLAAWTRSALLAATIAQAQLERGVPAEKMDVLSESVAREVLRHELRCEAGLALLRSVATDAHHGSVAIAPMLELATTRGRWSRRTEAVAWLRDRAHAGLTAGERELLVAAARRLTDRSEDRWVQPAGLELLAAVDRRAALVALRERLDHPGPGDDFLVRERMVEVAGRMRHGGFAELVTQASFDRSEHVRMTAAHVERRAEFLASAARTDPSHRVRILALRSLVRRVRGAASPTLVRAVEHDTHAFVVHGAARLLVDLAAKGQLGAAREVADQVAAACHRADLSTPARGRLVELLAELEVKSSARGRRAHDALAQVLESAPIEGGLRLSGPVVARWTDELLERVLAVLSRRDFGIGIDRSGEELVVYRSEARRTTLWRLIFELRNLAPSKRQGFGHTQARRGRGALRSPPGGLAELTATRVPGERVLVEELGDWGRHLPRVDDFLEATTVGAKTVRSASAAGTTVIVPARSALRRLRGWAAITRRYDALDALRTRSLASDEAQVRGAYLEEMEHVSGATVSFETARFGASGSMAPPPRALPVPSAPRTGTGAGASALLALAPVGNVLDAARSLLPADLVDYATSLHGNRLPQVAAYGSLILLGMMLRGVMVRRSIDRDRRAIPLVVGGWGTRGKSGTERLKAGLFQGLGYECLVKTTGCEAMFIHAVPGVPAREIFLYRPYDKASIWEQRDVLALAARFDVRVFLWECMALQPDLVNVLQMQWMRDDYSTVTNAYPDHEDVQGPTGYDVAECISEFVPTGGRLFTTEEQMLPILRQRARERSTSLHEVGEDESELVSDEVLQRFPYQEHPRNIALVASLAQAMGVPRTIALVEMADHVVPDLGVLKTYPEVVHEGRRLAFTNGMSANERTGALGNWKRVGFDQHDVAKEPARWIVTVVNNRADRVARSEVFARFIVEDIAAHRHVLIGSNLKGLVRFVEQALEGHLGAISPTVALAGSAEERRETALARVRRALEALKVPEHDAASVERECVALGWSVPARGFLEQLLLPAGPGESLAEARRAVQARLGEDASPFFVATVARRRCARSLLDRLEHSLEGDPALVERDFRAAYRALFFESLVVLDHPGLTGDAIIDRIARELPPGARASVMGLQNIKGTGLDFVYRWVSIDAVEKMVTLIESDDRARQGEGLRLLAMHGDFGVVDARRALAAVSALAGRGFDHGEEAAALEATLLRRVGEKERALVERARGSAGDVVRRFVGKTLDYVDSVRRRGMAKRVLDDLVAGHISHAAAASRMRDLVGRQKGAWLARKR